VADGFKFQRSWRIPNEDIIKYQEKLIKFIDFLTAKKEYLFIKKIIKKIFPNNYLKKLEVAMKFDPDFDSGNPEGRFVPLFKSTMYSVYFPEIFNGKTDNQIKTIFSDIYNLKDNKYREIRKYMLNKTLESTIEYIAIARLDRDNDPLRIIFPNALRCTIHSKPGQLGLTTTNKFSKIESWHGVGYFNLKGKAGVDFRISLESKGYLPVYIKGDPFHMKNQPIFYFNQQEKSV
jgi:hypothetical protein